MWPSFCAKCVHAATQGNGDKAQSSIPDVEATNKTMKIRLGSPPNAVEAFDLVVPLVYGAPYTSP